MARKKVTVVGAGHVGANTALAVARLGLGDVCLIDIVEGMPQGKSLDMMQSGPVDGFDVTITGTNDYADTADSDVVIITAGLPRKPGMDRSDLIKTNTNIISQIVPQIVKHSPNSILIIVTNPLDIMVYAAWKLSGFPKERVMGMAGALDSARLRAFLAMELNASVNDVHAMVIGGHADEMVPLKRFATLNGIPIIDILGVEKVDAIINRTKTAGGEIVGLLKTGSAYYAPSASAASMAQAILNDTKAVIPSAVLLEGEYGAEGVFTGVPVKLGSKGVEEIIELKLNDEEKAMFDESVVAIKKLISELEL